MKSLEVDSECFHVEHSFPHPRDIKVGADLCSLFALSACFRPVFRDAVVHLVDFSRHVYSTKLSIIIDRSTARVIVSEDTSGTAAEATAGDLEHGVHLCRERFFEVQGSHVMQSLEPGLSNPKLEKRSRLTRRGYAMPHERPEARNDSYVPRFPSNLSAFPLAVTTPLRCQPCWRRRLLSRTSLHTFEWCEWRGQHTDQ